MADHLETKLRYVGQKAPAVERLHAGIMTGVPQAMLVLQTALHIPVVLQVLQALLDSCNLLFFQGSCDVLLSCLHIWVSSFQTF